MVRLENDVLLDPAIGKDGTLAYTAIQIAYPKQDSVFLVNRSFLADVLFGGDARAADIGKALGSGIEKLLANGVLGIEGQYGNTLAVRFLQRTRGYFVLVEEAEIQAIMRSGLKNAQGLLHFYLLVLTTLTNVKEESEQVPIGCCTVERLASLGGISKKTVVRYTKTLERLALLFVYRDPAYYRDREGELKGIANTYGRFVHREKIAQAGKMHRKQYGSAAKQFKAAAGRRRADAQRYRAWLKGKRYSAEELEQIYRTLKEMNADYADGWTEKMKDLTPFAEYPFYTGET